MLQVSISSWHDLVLYGFITQEENRPIKIVAPRLETIVQPTRRGCFLVLVVKVFSAGIMG